MLAPLRTNAPRRRTATGKAVPAPVGGWDAVSPLAVMPDDRAIVLDNWFPQPGYVEVRKGSKVHGSGMGSAAVESLMVYNGQTVAATKMFAASDGAFWDASSSGNAASTSVTGLASNRWQYVNYTTSAGVHYLWACSGSDDVRHYNGSAWAAPSITGITSSDVIHANVHKKRIWVILKDSMDAAYLGLDSIAGAATKFPLGSVMQKGGHLVAMATWTRDAGSGPDDFAVFISSRGEVAVYQGTDPASDFLLVGVFSLGAPIGRRCFTKVAGDIALINIDGALPLSKALGGDRGAAADIAITKNINNAMNQAARLYSGNFGWELTPYAKGTMALLNVPTSEGSSQEQYVMNTLTGAWCRFTGWNANCFAVFKDNLYFGGNDGLIVQADTGAMDIGSPVDAVGQTAYNYFSARGSQKKFSALQPLISTDSATKPAIGMSTDFKSNARLGTPTTAGTDAAIYDTAIYDTDVYAVEGGTVADWTTVSGVGQCASIHFRAKTGPDSGVTLWGFGTWGSAVWSKAAPSAVSVRLNGFHITMEQGAFY